MDAVWLMKVILDTEKCVLAGECYFNHPELFDKNEDGVPVVLVSHLTKKEHRVHASQAAEVCPSGAITLFDKVTVS